MQFIWWTYLLFELNNEVYSQRSELIIYKSADPTEIIKEGNELNSKLHKKWVMIVGEGTIFLIIMGLGILQLRKTDQKEAALLKQQKNFLLSVTHELKSPLASAKLQLQTLQKRELDNEKQKEIISNAIADTERLNNLVENILLSARIDSDAATLAKEKTNVSKLVSSVVEANSRLIQQQIVMNIADDIFLDVDVMIFPSIILNLVENAGKYAPEDSMISVELIKNNGAVVFRVSDEGTTIPEHEKQEIFKKFYRIGNEETRKTKGTGLGLYIVKSLVEQHGGSLVVKNNSPKGNIFEITFIA